MEDLQCTRASAHSRSSLVVPGLSFFSPAFDLLFSPFCAPRLLPVQLSFLRFGGGDGESSFCGTSFGVDTTSDAPAVRVLRNPVAGGPSSSVALASGRRSANAVWTDAECRRDRGQRWNDASCRNALHAASREPDVADCDVENAATLSSRPSAAGTV
jgi:hypothetical protein